MIRPLRFYIGRTIGRGLVAAFGLCVFALSYFAPIYKDGDDQERNDE